MIETPARISKLPMASGNVGSRCSQAKLRSAPNTGSVASKGPARVAGMRAAARTQMNVPYRELK